ncbi:selenocysteine-specific translation elongation factor [Anoxybacter fermentans]|uniref:Selenocysteine-specific elongation factor n=1 Tax=Anoxybacter fermentans TaxID=1323375 RepID=A0A3Q9HSF0_9FIRM|nr:selenocysteine-specific translation elongation factor [Anoxybacter fermentans]AZR74580.1 selenocysteine-specific translation elongation factor [Anoxybacter fermentans]
MQSVIIGTAGHVDHGKTTLIRALTGVDTDRLKEEKERKLTIDLGFAPFDLPSGRRVSVIDVPGHKKFMGNMLAGIGGIDLVLLVIDANEGVMPQTREHLEVISLLQIKKMLVVLTKIDTVEVEWLDLVEEEVREELKDTPYKDAEIVRVSAVKGIGIEKLKFKIDEIIDTLEPKDINAPLRLPVDRSFKMKGFGTVITGTLLAGKVKKDQQVDILPQGLTCRVRNIEVHNQPVNEAYAGQRVALNLAGVEKEDVPRGSVIAQPGFFKPTDRLDVEIEVLPDFPYPLKHASRVHFHIGTSDLLAKVYLLEKKELLPGEKGFAQLELADKIVAYYQDLFIIRFYSPVKTMGGGRVLNVNPGLYRKYGEEEMAELKLLAGGSSEDLVLQQILRHGIISPSELLKEAKLAEKELDELLEKLLDKEMIIELGDGYLMALTVYRDWKKRILKKLEEFHKENHLKPGISRAELKQVLPDKLTTQKYDLFLEKLLKSGEIRLDQYMVALASFEPQPIKEEEKILKEIKKIFADKGIETPGIKELAREIKIDEKKVQEYLEYLMYLGEIVQIRDGYYLSVSVLNEVQDKVVNYLKEKGEITLAEARDLLESSRKYTLPIMEYFDQINLTRRKDNVRVLI